jgi:hypothetical protein
MLLLLLIDAAADGSTNENCTRLAQIMGQF